MAAKLSNETYVHYHGNISEQVTKVTQTKTNYDQFYTLYATRLLQPICLHSWSHDKTNLVLDLSLLKKNQQCLEPLIPIKKRF